jgi:hypothetical protein
MIGFSDLMFLINRVDFYFAGSKLPNCTNARPGDHCLGKFAKGMHPARSGRGGGGGGVCSLSFHHGSECDHCH